MSATASLPAPLHVRRGHIVGLSVAVAAVAVVALATTLAIRANSDTSSASLKVHPTKQQIVSTIAPTGTSSAATKAPSPSLQEIVSTINPNQDYVTGVVAMAPGVRAAAFGQTPAAAHQSLQQIVSTITPPRAAQPQPCERPAGRDVFPTARRDLRSPVSTSPQRIAEPGPSSAGLRRVDAARLRRWSGVCSARWPKRSGARSWRRPDADASSAAKSCSTRATPVTRST